MAQGQNTPILRFTFTFLIFYRSNLSDEIIYRKDLSDEEIQMPKEEFLQMVYEIAPYELYCQAITALTTFNYYLWDYAKEKIYLLKPKILAKERALYKSGSVKEILNKKQYNPYWNYQAEQAKKKSATTDIKDKLQNLGFEIPESLNGAFPPMQTSL